MNKDLKKTAKILILYYSKSGNTEKIAKLVAKGAKISNYVEVRLKSIEQATAKDLLWAEGIACGSPTQLGTISGEMKSWWDRVSSETWSFLDGKIGIPFTSTGSVGGGGELTLTTIHTIMQNHGMLTFGTTKWAGPKFSYHYGTVIAGEPRSDAEKTASELLGNDLARWVLKFYHQVDIF